MRGTAKLLVVLGGVSIWACAKANDSKLIYDGEERGGGAGAAGAAARGGTSSGKGGTGASGGSGNQGGSAGSSGKSSGGNGSSGARGGNANAGGSANSGGTSSGGSAASGDAGGGGIDPDVLARAKLVLHYIAKETQASSRSVEMSLFLENKSDDAVPLAPIAVRYWMTSEPSSRRMNSYYAAAATTGRALEFVSDGDDSYVEVTFASGSLPAHTSDLNSTEFQIKLDADTNFDQRDDHSFAPTLSAQPAAPHDKITVYLKNRLVWGCEPSGACPSEGEGGAGGEGGAAGQPGGGAGGEGGVTSGEGGQAGEPSAAGGQAGDGADGGAAGAVVN